MLRHIHRLLSDIASETKWSLGTSSAVLPPRVSRRETCEESPHLSFATRYLQSRGTQDGKGSATASRVPIIYRRSYTPLYGVASRLSQAGPLASLGARIPCERNSNRRSRGRESYSYRSQCRRHRTEHPSHRLASWLNKSVEGESCS